MDEFKKNILFEEGYVTDYENLTQSVASTFGYLLTYLNEKDEYYAAIVWLNEMLMHASYAIRETNKITLEEVSKLNMLYDKYYVSDKDVFFPYQNKLANGLVSASTDLKIIISMLQNLHEEGHMIDELLLAFFNLASNFCISLSKYIYFKRNKGDETMSEDSRFLACPYLYESGFVIDFELMSENLMNSLGFMTTFFDEGSELNELFKWLTERTFDVMVSVRTECKITEADVVKLTYVYESYHKLLNERIEGLRLPYGTKSSTTLNIIATDVKANIRMMYQLKKEGIEVESVLFDFMNLLANTCHILSLYINQEANVTEIMLEKRNSDK